MDAHSPDKILYECIERHPGIHFRDAARRTGLTLGTAHEYLGALERRSIVEAQHDGRYKRYFVRSNVSAGDLVLLMAFRGERTREIVVRLLSDGSATQRELAEAGGVTRSAIGRAMQSLVDRGLVASVHDRRQKRYSLIDPSAAADVLERFRESLYPSGQPISVVPEAVGEQA